MKFQLRNWQRYRKCYNQNFLMLSEKSMNMFMRLLTSKEILKSEHQPLPRSSLEQSLNIYFSAWPRFEIQMDLFCCCFYSFLKMSGSDSGQGHIFKKKNKISNFTDYDLKQHSLLRNQKEQICLILNIFTGYCCCFCR